MVGVGVIFTCHPPPDETLANESSVRSHVDCGQCRWLHHVTLPTQFLKGLAFLGMELIEVLECVPSCSETSLLCSSACLG